MDSLYATSRDGVRIAYDRSGEGRPLVLLHGGLVQDRRSWHQAGYVERLGSRFFVVAIDQRGHGASDRPATSDGYGAAAFVDDVHAVLDAEGIDCAAVWGYSLGAEVALQLGRASRRVTCVVAGGVGLGQWLTEETAQKRQRECETLLAAHAAGQLDPATLPPPARSLLTVDTAVMRNLFAGVVGWPPVEPEELRPPTFLYLGSADGMAMKPFERYRARLAAAAVRWRIFDGLDHSGEFDAVDEVVPEGIAFIRSLPVL
jgi:pimeloyl-ACP methyl ester carboxylesterase